jgi:DNA-binding IclR family transcriptional regulator
MSKWNDVQLWNAVSYFMPAVKSQVQRGLDLLDVLANAGQPMALGDLAARLNLPKSAMHRLLAQLSDSGWVSQDAATGSYGLTLKLAVMGQRFLHRTGLPDLYQPVLEQLARNTGEFARIAIVEDRGLTWVGQAQGARKGLVYQPELTATVPLAVTATGRAWLATLPDETALQLIVQQGLPPSYSYGPKARLAPGDILAELCRTRERGWGLAVEEAEAGVTAIAMVIGPHDGPGRADGTLSIAGPAVRLTPDRYESIVAMIGSAARDLAAHWPIRRSSGV